jgi:hypothetical protein
MKSRWFKLKPKAVGLRKQGESIVFIGETLGIPKSTLSGWLKNVILNKKQKIKLRNNSKIALNNARKKAVIWNNTQKRHRMEFAEQQAIEIINKIDLSSKEIFELAIAMLYLGEGFKKNTPAGIGNSDPLILKFFLIGIKKLFNIDPTKIRYDLHLRADQNIAEIKKYWSSELNTPIEKFTQVSIDQRTVGKPTYQNYKGVCVINCGNVAIQRRLVYLSRIFCEKIIESMGG